MLKNNTAAAGINTDCPSGSPKLIIFLSIPSLFSQVSMFVANAAEDDAVVSEIIKVGSSFLINLNPQNSNCYKCEKAALQ